MSTVVWLSLFDGEVVLPDELLPVFPVFPALSALPVLPVLFVGSFEVLPESFVGAFEVSPVLDCSFPVFVEVSGLFVLLAASLPEHAVSIRELVSSVASTSSLIVCFFFIPFHLHFE